MTISRRRGRPLGTGPNKARDENLLRQAARNLLYGISPNATSAFSVMLDQLYDRAIDDQDRAFSSALRRLQRQWRQVGARYVEEARRQAFSGRWKLEADQLEKSLPELALVINTFFTTEAGQAVLAKHGKCGLPAEQMSLDIFSIWEEIVRHSAVGPLRAEALFEKAYASWSMTGLEPDEAFLRRFAELCLAQADALRANAGMNAGDSDGERDDKDDATHTEGQTDER